MTPLLDELTKYLKKKKRTRRRRRRKQKKKKKKKKIKQHKLIGQQASNGT